MASSSLRTLAALAAAATAVVAATRSETSAPGRAKRSSGVVDPRVVLADAPSAVSAPAAPAGPGFSAQFRVGFTAGDQWEPAIAADDADHVFVLYPQYGGVPGCATCANPTMVLQRSSDGGATWEAPRTIAASGTGQWDAQIVVDAADRRTLYASWLQNRKSDTVVARSIDAGATWTVVVADRTNAGTDKPALAARGNDVYVGFNHTQKVWVSASHDGGATFTAREVNANAALGWSLAGGAAVGPEGNVYFGWAGYKQNGQAKGAVNLYVSRSTDGGATWTNRVLAVSSAPPDCSAYRCGWAYLGAQVTVAVDEGGTVYALWNAGTVDKGPERISFARSTDGGATWSPPADVSAAVAGTSHAFPALASGAAGDVRVFWMDNRSGGWWNTYTRRSTDRGTSWSAATDLSTPVPGYAYITASGFRFPFGDYFEAQVDGHGDAHVVWGEGFDYETPGSIWYARGR